MQEPPFGVGQSLLEIAVQPLELIGVSAAVGMESECHLAVGGDNFVRCCGRVNPQDLQ